MIEYWKETKCGKFLISTHGRLFSRERRVPTKATNGKWSTRKVGGHFIKMNISNTGYKRANMSGTVRLFHQVMAEEFLPHPECENPTINHKDLDKLNNNVSNLEWLSSVDNIKHAWGNGACDSMFTPVRCLDDGSVYPSLHAAAAGMGRAVGNLCSHLKGRQPTFAGKKWEYAKVQRQANGQ